MCWSLVAVKFIIFSSPDMFSISSYAWSWSVVSHCFTLHCGSTAYVCWATAPHPGLAHFKNKKLLGLLSFNNSLYVLDISPLSGKHFAVFSVCDLSLLIVDVVFIPELFRAAGVSRFWLRFFASLQVCVRIRRAGWSVPSTQCSCSWGLVTHTSMWSS